MDTTEYTLGLARFAADTTVTSLPSSTQDLLKLYILDNASAMLAGAVQPVYRSMVNVVQQMYGNGGDDAILAVDGSPSSLSGVMLLNGVAAGDFEFEHVIQNAHPASAVFPALLTVASTYHKTGEEFLAALAVGYELAVRIGFASTPKVEFVRGFHNPGINGGVAVAAAVGNLMRFDPDTIASAMGIAASSSAGLMAFVNSGAMTKRLHPARAGQLGVEAALMARAGMIGPKDVLENPEGFLHAFSPEPKTEYLLNELGTDWMLGKMIIKLSPVHAYAQTFVHAINRYRDQVQAWDADAITEVVVRCGPGVTAPSHRIVEPDSLVAAQYSVQFGIAAALAIDLRNPLLFDDELIRNATALTISKLIQFEQTTNDEHALGGSVILTIDEWQVMITTENYPGIPGHPGYVDCVGQKFKQVIEGLSIPQQQARKLRNIIDNVISISDISQLMDQLVAAGIVSKRGSIEP